MEENSNFSKVVEKLYFVDEYREDPELEEFFEQYDFALSLAIAQRTGMAELSDKGKALLQEAYDAYIEIAGEDE